MNSDELNSRLLPFWGQTGHEGVANTPPPSPLPLWKCNCASLYVVCALAHSSFFLAMHLVDILECTRNEQDYTWFDSRISLPRGILSVFTRCGPLASTDLL